MIPSIDELLAESAVLSLPMRTKFRGITTREVMLIRGPG
ncbi:O-succinylbenzoate synthase, partial [Rhodococcus sp. BP-148]|nr:O-succinylbenzoate synthase [Rhodococcus sp. BP-148]